MRKQNDYIMMVRDGINMIPVRWSVVARMFALGVLVYDRASGCYAVKGA